MNRSHFITLLSLLTLLNPVFTFSQTNQKATGNWSGTIDLPTAKLEMIFKISENESGKLVSKLDVPAQGAKDLPVADTKISGDSIFLNVAMILGKYEGKFTSDSTMEGTWKQSGMNFPLSFKKTQVVTELKRPQTPKPPFPYTSEDVEYMNPASGLKLAGTLTLPANAIKCPAVILISGSGAQDRNETIFGHKPFLVIADYLTRKGIAVLRVDDRGVGGSEGNTANATSEDFAGDVIAGLDFLKTRNEIDHKKTGLIGHSEGGLIAPLVATKSKDVAFIVLLAGPGIKGEQIIYSQVENFNRAAGLSEEQINQKMDTEKAVLDILLNQKDSSARIEQLQNVLSESSYNTLSADQKKAIDIQTKAVNTPWFRFFLAYDPFPVLEKVKCPVLALNGAKDLQVPPKENLEAIKKALTEGGNKNFKTMEIPGLNHLFQHCKTCLVSEYATIEETISPEVLEIIYNWIWNSALKD